METGLCTTPRATGTVPWLWNQVTAAAATTEGPAVTQAPQVPHGHSWLHPAPDPRDSL